MAMTRRALVAGIAAGMSQALAQQTIDQPAPGFRREVGPKPRTTPPICLYTDQLPLEIGYEEMGGLLKTMGFDGADVVVQPGGHIVPEHADLNFERAIEALNGSGMDVYMVSTPFTSPVDPTLRLAMQWSGEMGVRCFRPGHWKYGAAEIEQTMAEAQRDISGLAAIARAVGISVGLHNAPGSFGASLFDTNMVIRTLDPRLVGYDFDAGNAAALGGSAGFATALKLALPRLKMVTARDCVYTKDGDGWKLAECPLGEGMVDWPRFFAALAQSHFAGPISLQTGYAGKESLLAIKKDLAFLKQQRAIAYGS
jgi:L-ribulose-5-phosphate 3-epimerase